jgi:hypothetical protein
MNADKKDPEKRVRIGKLPGVQAPANLNIMKILLSVLVSRRHRRSSAFIGA